MTSANFKAKAGLFPSKPGIYRYFEFLMAKYPIYNQGHKFKSAINAATIPSSDLGKRPIMIEKIQHLSDSAVLPSNRSFGLLFTVVFLIIAAYTGFGGYSTQWVNIWLIVAGIFLAFTLLFPVVLTPLNKMWFALGLLLGKVVSPVVLGILFFVVITPVAIVTRLFGRDALLLKKRAVSSYWIDRDPAGPKPESFKDQF
jgi:hypothetical protein